MSIEQRNKLIQLHLDCIKPIGRNRSTEELQMYVNNNLLFFCGKIKK